MDRQEYPALLVDLHSKGQDGLLIAHVRQRSLSPNHAVAVLEERVKLIGKINYDIADWLAVRISPENGTRSILI